MAPMVETALWFVHSLLYATAVFWTYSRVFTMKPMNRIIRFIGIFIFALLMDTAFSLSWIGYFRPFYHFLLYFATLHFFYEGKILAKLSLVFFPLLNLAIMDYMSFFITSTFFPDLPADEAYVTGFIIKTLLEDPMLFLIPIAFKGLKKIDISNRHWIMVLTTLVSLYVLTYLQGILISQSKDAYTYSWLIVLIYLLLAYSSLFITKEIARHYAATSTEKVSAAQYGYYSAQLEQMQEANKTVSDLRHELRNNLSAMRIELDKGKLDSIRQRLDSQLGLLENPQTRPGPACSDNPDVNGIINLKAKDAAVHGVVVEAHLQLPAEISVSTFDLSAVLGNAMDNAIEATCALPLEQRRVHVQMRTTGAQLEITVSNPYSDKVIFRDGEPVSTKPSSATGIQHGYGYKVMRQVAEKHDGYLFASHEDGVFTLSVFLNIE